MSFPLKSALCHCSSCRHATGQLFATFAVIPRPIVADAPGFSKLIRYKSSTGLSRYFCPKCGASVINSEAHEWEYASGVVEFLTDNGGNAHDLLPGGLFRRALLFVGDSLDGGAVPWINEGKINGLLCRKMEHRNSQEVTESILAGMQDYSKNKKITKGSKLAAKCHCGNVAFNILALEGKERYPASLCACTSCRKACGFEITSWARIPRRQISMTDGRSLDEGLKDIGLYKSSEKVRRHFCKKCGATISYQKEGADTIDIAPGLFEALEGSRAELWLEWNQDGDDLSYREDALDKNFAERLASGVRRKTKQ